MERARVALKMFMESREATMDHHIVYWKLARREADVTDAQLAALQTEEDRGELYIEFLDGRRLPLVWEHEASHWRTIRAMPHPAAA
jgi:hypothetical protein